MHGLRADGGASGQLGQLGRADVDHGHGDAQHRRHLAEEGIALRPNKRVRLDLPKEKLETAPGFDKENWPKGADTAFIGDVYRHFGTPQYW
jgi:hypothetical protein